MRRDGALHVGRIKDIAGSTVVGADGIKNLIRKGGREHTSGERVAGRLDMRVAGVDTDTPQRRDADPGVCEDQLPLGTWPLRTKRKVLLV